MKKNILILLFLAVAVLAFSQQEQTEQVHLDGILNFSFDYELAEDGEGTIWAIHTFINQGLETALIKYDGENWSSENFLCTGCLKDLEVDNEGNLWAAADTEGIYKYENDAWIQVLTDPAIKLAFQSDGTLIFTSRDGVSSYRDGTANMLSNINKPNFFTIEGYVMDLEDQLWILASDALYKYSPTAGWVERNEVFGPSWIDKGPDNKLWIANNTGAMSYIEDDVFAFNQIRNVFPAGLEARSLTVDMENRVWAGVEGSIPGVTFYHNDSMISKTYAAQEFYNSSNAADEIFVTSEGEVWAFENNNNTVGHIFLVDAPIDEDQDGFAVDVDCDDNNAAINPEAEEIPNNDIDENCDGEMLVIDEDQDGFNSDIDCDDNNAAINPEAEEIANNDIDENCDGEMLVIDEDQDGFNSDVDCNDNDAAINPGAVEIENNDIDENCDGELGAVDNDQDGFNSDVDCDDNNAAINPDAEEIANNDVDENCDGEMLVIDEDQDGFNSDVDCDDNNAAINPDAIEIENNDIDENCDGEMLVIDIDQDGFNSDVDCNDNDAAINPDATEIPNNQIDENCDGEDLTSSIEELDLIKVSINPNPSKGNSRISFSEVVENGTILIYTLDGRMSKTLTVSSPMLYIDINTSNFHKGMYIVKLMAKNQQFTAKLIVE